MLFQTKMIVGRDFLLSWRLMPSFLCWILG